MVYPHPILSLLTGIGRRRVCVPMLILLLAAPLIAAPVGTAKLRHRIAILADANAQLLPCIGLLEAQLSNRADIALVEREQLAKIMAEQSLSTLSGAASCANRLAIGKLLNAEMLVILTRRNAQDKALGVVVSETRQGLRLRVTQLPADVAPEATADALHKELDAALKKSAETIRLIAAVPPLINKDLTRDRDYLQGSYAHILQELLLSLRGVIVVDTEEAKAIGAELALSGSNSITRGLPVYLLGEFRCETRNEQAPPYVMLTLRLGERELGHRQADRLEPAAIPAFLRKATVELLALADQRQVTLPDPVLEAQELLKRARQFYLVGTYPVAAELAEASLLLDSKQAEAHRLAMTAYGRCALTAEYSYPNEAIRYSELAGEHIASFIENTDLSKIDSPFGMNLLSEVGEALRTFPYLSSKDKARQERYLTAASHLRDAFHRAILAKYQEGALNDWVLAVLLDHWARFLNESSASSEENLTQRLDMIPLVVNPNVKVSMTYQFVNQLVGAYGALPDSITKQPVYATFLTTLEQKKYSHPSIAIAIKTQRDYLRDMEARERAWRENPIMPPVAPPSAQNGSPEVIYTPANWTYEGKVVTGFGFQLCGLLPCGDGVDLIWGGKGGPEGIHIYLMREKNILSRIVTLQGNLQPTQATFDGKYAWVPIIGKKPSIVIIDIASGQSMILTAENGLPPFETIVSTAIDPGKLCLCGTFDSRTARRSYIALVTMQTLGDCQVKVVHEATKQLDLSQDLSMQWQDPQLNFSPGLIMTKTGVDGHQYVYIMRNLTRNFTDLSQLIVNLNTGEVRVKKIAGNFRSNWGPLISDCTAYWIAPGGIPHLEDSGSEVTWIKVAVEPLAKIVFCGGRVHMVYDSWYVADRLGEPFRKLNIPVPVSKQQAWLSRIYNSNHYGLILYTYTNNQWVIYQVTFPGLPAK
ncbi:MAG: hypothetical protein ACYC7E_15320 [Armatimonadota bacterium]